MGWPLLEESHILSSALSPVPLFVMQVVMGCGLDGKLFPEIWSQLVLLFGKAGKLCFWEVESC